MKRRRSDDHRHLQRFAEHGLAEISGAAAAQHAVPERHALVGAHVVARGDFVAGTTGEEIVDLAAQKGACRRLVVVKV